MRINPFLEWISYFMGRKLWSINYFPYYGRVLIKKRIYQSCDNSAAERVAKVQQLFNSPGTRPLTPPPHTVRCGIVLPRNFIKVF